MIIWKTCSHDFIDNVVTLRLRTTRGDKGWTGRGGSPRSCIKEKTKNILLRSFYIIKSNNTCWDTKRPTSYTKFMVNYRHIY